ncbi:MAG TPA: hypothetical protein VHR17_15595 [Thermoanaerobaculia bacterium]|nr:hypothetical protein [Thermoanaerobaculia bacterium]
MGRLWIRQAFRDWPSGERRWIDLAQGRMRRAGAGSPPPTALAIDAEGGLLYVPPVDREHAATRDALVASLALRGVPALVQLVAGEAFDSGAAPETIVIDPLEALLERRLEVLDEVPPRAVVLWPLIAGLTDDEAQWSEACARLRAAGAACVQPLALELDPAERRELAGGEIEGSVYSRLFHGRAASERRFAALAASHGFEVFHRRPAREDDRRERNAALAELLALAGELWLRLGRGEVAGQELFRASRWVEDAAVDVRALAAEGNLEIVEALRAPGPATIIAEWARAGASRMVESWLAEYVTLPAP